MLLKAWLNTSIQIRRHPKLNIPAVVRSLAFASQPYQPCSSALTTSPISRPTLRNLWPMRAKVRERRAPGLLVVSGSQEAPMISLACLATCAVGPGTEMGWAQAGRSDNPFRHFTDKGHSEVHVRSHAIQNVLPADGRLQKRPWATLLAGSLINPCTREDHHACCGMPWKARFPNDSIREFLVVTPSSSSGQ